jgi:hypothetical protein
MNAPRRLPRLFSALIAALALSMFGGLAAAADLMLSGDNEVPPVKTTASGSGAITVASDGSVSGSVKTTGVEGTMAHIHMGAAGSNGPVIVPLTKTADGTWSVPPGAKLNDEQLKSYKAGGLYVNVHSAANKGGEIRAQLVP